MDETDNRRSSRRWRTVLQAQIVFNNCASILNCTVRDLSDTGARIYFADVSELPPAFDLVIPNRGVRVQARVMWSRGANHGVMFSERLKAWTDSTRTAAA
jgi:hypothetical protein